MILCINLASHPQACGPLFFRNSGCTLSMPRAFPVFILSRAWQISSVVKAGGRLSTKCYLNWSHWSWTPSFKMFVSWCFVILIRCAVTALALTGGWLCAGGLSLAPSRQMSVQLFLLVWKKYRFLVVSFQRWRLAASNDSSRCSAMSRSPESSYCCSNDWHCLSRHGIYIIYWTESLRDAACRHQPL